MPSKKVVLVLICLGLISQALANPTLGKKDSAPEYREFVSPQESVDFALLVNPVQSILKINGDVYHYGQLDYLEMYAPEGSSITATNLKMNDKNVADLTLSNGDIFQKYASDLPETFLLKGTLTSNMSLNGLPSGAAIFKDNGGGHTSPNIPVVPAPGAILLGSYGLFIVSWLRKKVL